MLDNLPPEILEHIIGHLPTLASIANLASVNHGLYKKISANDYAIFRDFVQRKFPSIRTPPFWREAAVHLTSRSRAWDRRAFIARECRPKIDDSDGPPWLDLTVKFGFVPVIDSYESFDGNSFSTRKEVLAIGAAGRLRLRIKQKGTTTWRNLRFADDHLPQFDIVDLKLLRPHQIIEPTKETLVVRRANDEMTKVEYSANDARFNQVALFDTGNMTINCCDTSNSADPLLAVCGRKSIRLFSTTTRDAVVSASHVLQLDNDRHNLNYRRRCAKFLDDETLATAVQYVEGRTCAPIETYKLTPYGFETNATTPHKVVSVDDTITNGRHAANTIAALDDMDSLVGRPGQVFLSGWTDGVARLHDLRASEPVVSKFVDHVDDGQIMCILPVGHERFFAGSHQNACLKIFDLRMPGSRTYSSIYMPQSKHSNDTTTSQQSSRNPAVVNDMRTRRDINIFLALTINRGGRLWQPLPRRQDANLSRYRGSIYSLASPSPSSSTIYAGITNHVVQLDFISTDDMRVGNESRRQYNFAEEQFDSSEILNLSCYERPRPGHEVTDPVLLRKQMNWSSIVASDAPAEEEGWDERWRLASSLDESSRHSRGSRWRRRGPI